MNEIANYLIAREIITIIFIIVASLILYFYGKSKKSKKK